MAKCKALTGSAVKGLNRYTSLVTDWTETDDNTTQRMQKKNLTVQFVSLNLVTVVPRRSEVRWCPLYTPYTLMSFCVESFIQNESITKKMNTKYTRN